MQITKEDWDRWKADAVTQEVLKMLQERQAKIAHQLGAGACLGDDSGHGTAVGRYLEIDDLLEMDYEDLEATE